MACNTSRTKCLTSSALQVTLRSPWVAAYLRSPRMVDERKELFLYVVICSALLRSFQVFLQTIVLLLTSQNSADREGEKPETDRDGQTKIFL